MLTKAHEISNMDDVIDSRDVIARIELLQQERDYAAEVGVEALAEWDGQDKDELDVLTALQEEAEGYAADWKYGEVLIRDSYFKSYAMQLADDLGAINAEATWPNNCIDWDRAARDLQMDYTSVDFAGVTYWVR